MIMKVRVAVSVIAVVLMGKGLALAVIGLALFSWSGVGGAAVVMFAVGLGAYGLRLGIHAIRGEAPRWLRHLMRGMGP